MKTVRNILHSIPRPFLLFGSLLIGALQSPGAKTRIHYLTFNRSSCSIFTVIFLLFALAEASGNASFTCVQLYSSAAGTQLVSSSTATQALDSRLVKDVVELADKEEIPQAVYDGHSVDEIARAIVKRTRDQEIQFSDVLRVDEHKSLNVFEDTDIILFFRDADLSSIGERGFLNQHLTGKSRGTLDQKNRLSVEDNVTGIKLGSGAQALRLRPKSAFLNIRTETELAYKLDKITFQYGSIGAVLKAEAKERSIWVSSDSLALGGLPHLLGLYMNYSGNSLVPYRGTFYRESLPCQSKCTAYYEALVFGELRFSNVDYFLVENSEQVDSLKPYGRPIYSTQQFFKNKRVIFAKGEMLFAGTDVKLPSAASSMTERE